MIKYLINKVVFSNRLEKIAKKKELYITTDDILNYQLNKFNKVWKHAYENIPFYEEWKRNNSLPDYIRCLEELNDFPVLTKRDIQNNEEIIFSNLNDYIVISTGGSTGEPTKFPTSYEEGVNSYANHYLARGWWGIKPLDNVLLFWGHSHLFGNGIKGRVSQYKRVLFDWLINTRRLNAYDMSVNTLEKYFQVLKKTDPTMIIGYTSTIYKLAKYVLENQLNIGDKSNLKGVVVTSETVTDYDIEIIEKVFQVPCIIEYGMAETGVIAYSKGKTRTINIFWDSFIGIKGNNDILNITTINEKIFPLINYQTDDVIKSSDSCSVLTITEIMGRKKDILRIEVNGTILDVSGILMIHALKAYKGIYEIQFKQLENYRVKIIFTANERLDIENVCNFFVKNLQIDHGKLSKSCFDFQQVDEISKTIAGKAKWIEVENEEV